MKQADVEDNLRKVREKSEEQEAGEETSETFERNTCKNRNRSTVTTTDSGRIKFDALASVDSQGESEASEAQPCQGGAGNRGDHNRSQCGQKFCGRCKRRAP